MDVTCGLEAVGPCGQVKRQNPTRDAIQSVKTRGGKAGIRKHFSTDVVADRVVAFANIGEWQVNQKFNIHLL